MTKLSSNRSPKLLLITLLFALLVTPAISGKMADDLQGKLVKVGEGDELASHILVKEPLFYVFFFDASSSKSEEIMPQLVSRYRTLKKKRPYDFEFILVSYDVSAEEMKNHMVAAGMPWPALAYNQRKLADGFRIFSGDGIPSLVLITKEGRFVDGSYEDKGAGEWKGVMPVVETLEKLLEVDNTPQSQTVDSAVESAEDVADAAAEKLGVSTDRLLVASILAIATFIYLFFKN